MKNQMRFKREPLIVGGVLVFISFVVGRLIPSTANMSPMALFEQGMVEVISGIVGLLGWTILLVTFLASYIRKPSPEIKCSKCGAIASLKTDRFCRTCGERFA